MIGDPESNAVTLCLNGQVVFDVRINGPISATALASVPSFLCWLAEVSLQMVFPRRADGTTQDVPKLQVGFVTPRVL